MTALDSIIDLPLSSKPLGMPSLDGVMLHKDLMEARLPRGVAGEAAFLVNGDSYFSTLAQVLPQARRSIWIIGWDFNPDISLEPEKDTECLGHQLAALADASPELEVNILVWALGPIYSGKSLRLLRRRCFPHHERVRLRFHMHPDIRGSHHQKIVCIDDRIAFVGGIDLTSRRWDTWHHHPDDARRRDTKGAAYDPLHDVQAMVTGEAARLVGDVARHRWLDATGETVEPLASLPDAPLRVPDVTHALKDVPVSVALTDRSAGRQDGMAATRDVIRAARRQLYVETQYLANFSIADLLAERLREPDGPEIVIICTRSSHGMVEKVLMANNCDRIIRRLRQEDRHDRLRVYYPVVPSAAGEQEVLVHSKLLIADTHLLRIGSSNINNRSEAMDTECDLLFDASDDSHGAVIGGLRDTLIAEHLGLDGPAFRRAHDAHGSLIAAIEALNTGARGLRAFQIEPEGSTEPVPGTALLDPKPDPEPQHAV